MSNFRRDGSEAAHPGSAVFSSFLLLTGEPVCISPSVLDLTILGLAPLGISKGLARLCVEPGTPR